MVRAIVGANWGDEGKGKITDLFAGQSDIVIRFQGGANAGHTIINEHGRFAFHLMPSGVCYDHTTCIIGNGVALDINKFCTELDDIKKAGLNPKLLVSERAQILMPYHILLDEYEEERLGKNAFGSTKSGIAPFFSDKYAKIGIQVNELFDDETLKAKLKNICTLKNLTIKYVYNKPLLDEDELYKTCLEYREKIAPYVCDTHAYLQNALKEGKNILLEGQLGTLKDPDFGIYPMVTSSSTLAGYGAVGAGLPPHSIEDIVVVTKAYSSAVGAGEFISEILDEDEAQELRIHGGDKGEFGATTGRPRRCGWLDIVILRETVRLCGLTDIALTKLDVLSGFDTIQICVAYDYKGKRMDYPPQEQGALDLVTPVYESMPGWKEDITACKTWDELPEAARAYVQRLEQLSGVPVSMVSVGPDRNQTIFR